MKYLFLALIICSCGPTWHLKQAEKHMRKAQLKGAKEQIDTVYITKTITVPEVRIDTLFQRVDFHDTITFMKDRVVTRVKVDTVNKSVFIETICPPDTLKIEVPVTITKEINTGFDWWWFLVVASAGLIVGFILRRK